MLKYSKLTVCGISKLVDGASERDQSQTEWNGRQYETRRIKFGNRICHCHRGPSDISSLKVHWLVFAHH